MFSLFQQQNPFYFSFLFSDESPHSLLPFTFSKIFCLPRLIPFHNLVYGSKIFSLFLLKRHFFCPVVAMLFLIVAYGRLSMSVLSDFVGMPALHNQHCFTFSTPTLAELRRKNVPDCLSCTSECKHRKCRCTVLLVGSLDPAISLTTHSSKSLIFSFLFDLVVILPKLIHELFIIHLSISLCEKQNSQIRLELIYSFFIFFNNFCWQIYWSYFKLYAYQQ